MVLVARAPIGWARGYAARLVDAIIADDTTRENRGRALVSTAPPIPGAVVGPLIGLGLYELVGQKFRPLLWIALIPTVISVGARVPHP